MRPPVSVVVPFLGDEAQGRELVERLIELERRPGDELIVADNCPRPVVRPGAHRELRVIAVSDRRSAAHARNAAAATAAGDWLLFVDADCMLPADLLDRYFQPLPAEGCAVVAGEIRGDPVQDSVLARWARSRRGGWTAGLQQDGLRPAGVTANMMVRREAFEGAGGFRPGGGADLDLSWRLQDAGWQLEYRPQALVLHRDRERLRELGAQARSYGADRVNLRHVHGAAAVPRPKLLRPLARALGGSAAWLARGERERARFSLVDGYYFANAWLGALTGGPRRRHAD